MPNANVVVNIPQQVIAKVLKTRLTDHVDEDKLYKANKIFPAEKQLSYETYLVAFQHVVPNKGYYSSGFNFLFSNGTGTKYPPSYASPSDWSTVRLQDHHKD